MAELVKLRYSVSMSFDQVAKTLGCCTDGQKVVGLRARLAAGGAVANTQCQDRRVPHGRIAARTDSDAVSRESSVIPLVRAGPPSSPPRP